MDVTFNKRPSATPGAELRKLLEEVLAATVEIQGADFGHIELYDGFSRLLVIVAHHGFDQNLLNDLIKSSCETTVSGRALTERQPIVIEDIREDPRFASHCPLALAAGYVAVQATPMFGRVGQPLGVISTHFRRPHRPSDSELRLTGLYRRLASEVVERQTIEDALRTSEARLQVLVEKLPAGVYLCDADGYITYFNEAATLVWGRRPPLNRERWCGSPKLYRQDGTAVPLEVCPMALVLKGEETVLGEELIIERADGTRRNVAVYPRSVRTPAGEIAGAVNMIFDITDSMADRQALKQSEERFRRYFDLGVVGMAITSPDKGIVEVNEELCRILGYTRQELLQKNWNELAHPDDLAADVALFESALAGERDGYTLDNRWFRKDGQIVHSIVSTKCHRRADGSVDYFVGLLQDHTERKRVDERLRRSEAYLAEGQRISHIGTWLIRMPSEEVFCSDEVFRIYAIEPQPESMSLEYALSLVHPDDRTAVEQSIRRSIRDKTGYALEHRAILPDGTLKHLHVLGHPVLNDMGGLVEYIGTVADITERKRNEQALQRLQSELAHFAGLTTMGELAAAIAHEVNQPLGAIANNASVAMRLATARDINVHELLDVLSDIVGDSNRASDIVTRMRGLMKRAHPFREPLRIGDVVRDVLALADRELADRRIAVRLEIPEELPGISGDRVQLRQVIFNLVLNAAEAMAGVPETMRILTISACSSEHGGRPAVLVTVRDTGCGFAVEDSERLFEALYTTKVTGLGMGLRISGSIVEAHGGHLWAQPNQEPGATFLFSLPVTAD